MGNTDRSAAPADARRRFLKFMIAGGALGSTSGLLADEHGLPTELQNNLNWAVAWKQSAAEFFALCHQAFNLARMHVDAALENHAPGDKRLAVITDMDDTIMHARSYWGYLVANNMDFFDDPTWDAWLPDNEVSAAPGARAFFDYCREKGVEVFYVTNRNQGERTFDYALAQLRFLQMPYADEDHLYVFRDTSDKSPAREEIATRFDVAVMLGDNLNDFRRDYYVSDVDERMALMERDSADWGRRFVLLPNPTDGHWVRAIFGDSEPPPTDENRRKLREAASRIAWSGN